MVVLRNIRREAVWRATFFAAGGKNVGRLFFAGAGKEIEAPFL